MHARPASNVSRAAIPALCVLVIASLALTGCSNLPFIGGDTSTEPTVVTPPASPDDAASADDTATPPAEEPGDVGAGVPVEPELPALPQPANWARISELVARGARLVNCDTAADFKLERVKGSANVPLSSLDSSSKGWNEDSPVVLTSMNEPTARSAAGHLSRAGFSEVYYLEGGHDAWDGSFEGTDARKATTPARIIYLYGSNSDLPVIAGNYSSADIARLSIGIADEMDELDRKFSDVSVTTMDYKSNPSGVLKTFQDYDTPTTRANGAEFYAVPSWILVDKEGRVMHLNGLPLGLNSQRVFGWMVEQQESR